MDKNKRNKSAENTTDARIENPDIEVNDIETPETDGMPEEENVEAAELEKVKELLNQKEQGNRKRKERIPLSYGGIRQLPQTYPP